MGPICAGAHLAGDDSKKISTHATHAATEKLLAGSATTWSIVEHNREASQRRVGRDRANVKLA
jgi:hypothetical protein